MQKPKIVSVSPMKHNIAYDVAQKSTVSHTFTPIANKLAEQRTDMGRLIVFRRMYDEVTSIYHFFKRRLGERFTEPQSAPDLARFRLVDMFTHCCHESVKNAIMARFTAVSSLRIVIATVAFVRSSLVPAASATSPVLESKLCNSRATQPFFIRLCTLFHCVICRN